MAAPNDIVLFHYSFSPYARRIIWYLALRGINYAQCIQPPTLPRPDLTALGIHYRRIPVLTIGRDIYCDTRLILSKLESLFPGSPLGAKSPDQLALQQLLSKWCIEGGIFVRSAQLIPPAIPLLKDPKFKTDREELTGRSWSMENIEQGRPEALAAMVDAFAFLERLFGDGRDWVLGGAGPNLADIEAVWPFHWLIGMKGALSEEFISAKQYPKVFAWVDRFSRAVDAARKKSKKPTTLKAPEAAKHILQARFAEPEGNVEADPLGLRKGQEIEAWPTDSGSKHHDRGSLLSLTRDEVVMACKAPSGEDVRIHYPRTNFRIKEVGGDSKARL